MQIINDDCIINLVKGLGDKMAKIIEKEPEASLHVYDRGARYNHNGRIVVRSTNSTHTFALELSVEDAEALANALDRLSRAIKKAGDEPVVVKERCL